MEKKEDLVHRSEEETETESEIEIESRWVKKKKVKKVLTEAVDEDEEYGRFKLKNGKEVG